MWSINTKCVFRQFFSEILKSHETTCKTPSGLRPLQAALLVLKKRWREVVVVVVAALAEAVVAAAFCSQGHGQIAWPLSVPTWPFLDQQNRKNTKIQLSNIVDYICLLHTTYVPILVKEMSIKKCRKGNDNILFFSKIQVLKAASLGHSLSIRNKIIERKYI